ncbi:hypothetical protein [Szabonella alba]|uniref:Uncharacterized protein n=1 Tax=Szabonella alba TaxID=2804194 RepID=A0A8K0VC13_9RHOB|nr:hypothetical protein [Szabonella alba]MBL4919312.1 hypothetical protein [Szabonella alba]
MGNPLLSHIQRQHDVAITLEGVLEAVSILRAEQLGENAVDSLMVVALDLVGRLTQDLDSINLPVGRDRALYDPRSA